MRQWLLITEDELYAWSQSYSWRLPQKPISTDWPKRQVLRALDKRCASLSENDEDSLIVAEFDCEGASPGASQLPFYLVDVVYGFSVQRAAILKDRYEAFGLKSDRLDVIRTDLCRRALKAHAENAESTDIQLGARAMLEIFRMTPPSELERVLKESGTAIKGEGDTLLAAAFAYSRSDPWQCEGVLAGLCDLGKILRGRLSGGDIQNVQKLSQRVAESLRRGERSCYATIAMLLQGLPQEKGFIPELVLFLAWKYATERRNGQIDLECIKQDVADALSNDATEAVKSAICLLGAFSGFSALADVYHQFMRDMKGERKYEHTQNQQTRGCSLGA